MPLRASARHQLGKLTYQRVGFVGFGDESSASRQRAGIGLNPSGGYANGDLPPTLGDHARERQAGHSRHLDTGEYRRSEEHTSELQSLFRIYYAVLWSNNINTLTYIK